MACPAQTSQATAQAVKAVVSTLASLASTVRSALSPQPAPAVAAQVPRLLFHYHHHLIWSHMSLRLICMSKLPQIQGCWPALGWTLPNPTHPS